MIRALYSAASGMNAQQMNVDNIANNLANANTTGYKMRRAQFQDLIYQTVIQPGSASGQQTLVPTGLQVGLGTRSSSNRSEERRVGKECRSRWSPYLEETLALDYHIQRIVGLREGALREDNLVGRAARA